jgi:hypothetical protein
MRALPNDYDSDPSRFLSAEKHPHDDVHPYVAAGSRRRRADRAGCRRGQREAGAAAARAVHALPAHRPVTGDAEPGPRPAARADGGRLPVADACADAVAALYTLYHYDDPLVPIRGSATGPAAGRTVRGLRGEPGHRPGTGPGHPQLGRRFPLQRRGRRSDRGIRLRRSRRHGGNTAMGDAPLVTLSSVPDAVACLRVYGAQRGNRRGHRRHTGPAADADQARLPHIRNQASIKLRNARGISQDCYLAGEDEPVILPTVHRLPSALRPGAPGVAGSATISGVNASVLCDLGVLTSLTPGESGVPTSCHGDVERAERAMLSSLS